MSAFTYHVVPHDRFEWAVKREGAICGSFFSRNKGRAVSWAKRLGRFYRGRVVIHADGGGFEENISYKDVTPPTIKSLFKATPE